MIEIEWAAHPEQFEQVRHLMRSFVDWHRQRHVEDLQLIDAYFDASDFEEELASLPGKYSPPTGRLLLASYEGRCAGCVALRPLDARACEMKRMFVYDHFRGKGVGRALAAAVIREARAIDYLTMRLDTSIRQVEAIKLYEKLGFKRIKPYYQLPERLENWLIFMELTL